MVGEKALSAKGKSIQEAKRERSHHNMLCCTSTVSEFFKLNGHTENKLVITGPTILPFTLNKCRLVTSLTTQSKQSRAYTPLQKMRGIFLCNRDLQNSLNPTLTHGAFSQHHTQPAFSDMGKTICNKPPYFNNS